MLFFEVLIKDLLSLISLLMYFLLGFFSLIFREFVGSRVAQIYCSGLIKVLV